MLTFLHTKSGIFLSIFLSCTSDILSVQMIYAYGMAL